MIEDLQTGTLIAWVAWTAFTLFVGWKAHEKLGK